MSSVCPHGNYEGDDEACGRCANEERKRRDRLENFVRRLAENGLAPFAMAKTLSEFNHRLKQAAKAALEGK